MHRAGAMAWGALGLAIAKAEPASARRETEPGAGRPVAGAGTGGWAGHAVNPSMGARMRHPCRITVPPTHPHRHLDGRAVSHRDQERGGRCGRIASQAGARPGPGPTIHPTPPHSTHPTLHQAQLAQNDQSEAHALPLIFVAHRPATEVPAWVSLRGPEPHGCGDGAYKDVLAACPANLPMPAPFPLPAHRQPFASKNQPKPQQQKKRPRRRNRFFVYCICTADFLW